MNKRIQADICPVCDGTVLAPQSLDLHIKAEHPAVAAVFDAILETERARLLEAIGSGDEDSGLEHWHYASGGRSTPTERAGVFVDRAAVLALLADQ